jgi:hypothetical protein
MQTAHAQLARLVEEERVRTERARTERAAEQQTQRDVEAKLRATQRELVVAVEDAEALRHARTVADRRHAAELDLLRAQAAQRDATIATLQAEGAAARQALACAPSVQAYEQQLLTKNAEIQLLQSRLKAVDATALLQRKLEGAHHGTHAHARTHVDGDACALDRATGPCAAAGGTEPGVADRGCGRTRAAQAGSGDAGGAAQV